MKHAHAALHFCFCLHFSVGLLLDLDAGTLTVYKNGVMKDGLSGEYCWLMSVQGASNSTAVQIKRGYIPKELR